MMLQKIDWEAEEGLKGFAAPATEEVEADDSGEKREVVKMPDPREPSEEERRERNLTHLPFRSWRPHCVRSRGQGQITRS